MARHYPMLAGNGRLDQSSEIAPGSRVLDLIDLPFWSDDSIHREGATFIVSRPWALARFGSVALSSGWWRLECEPVGDASQAEIRITSPQDPLLVFRASHSEVTRVYLNSTVRDISLLVSAWPGRFEFKVLRFRRLSDQEQRTIALAALGKLISGKRSPSIYLRSLQRLVLGQSIGVKLAPAKSVDARHDAHQSSPDDAQLRSPRIINVGNVEAVLREQDQLHASAIDIISREFERRPELVALYSDVEEGGRIVPHPRWDPELTRFYPLPSTPFFFRTGGSGLNPDPKKRFTELRRFGAGAIDRIPLPLVRRRSAFHFDGRRLPIPKLDHTPRVSIIIPTKFRLDLLELCLEGLERRTDYPEMEIIIVDNGSTDTRFRQVMKATSARLDIHTIFDGDAFNFSRLINRGAEVATGDIVLLLNDDVVPLESGWLHRMVEAAMRQDVGAVGARLLFPDQSVQHAGVALGIGGVCGHLWKGMSLDEASQNPYVSLPGSRLAVTGACLAVRRDVFHSVGGLDPLFAVALNDIDFCLRLGAAGYRNIYRGDAVLAHHESQSRGQDDASRKKRKRLIKETEAFFGRWQSILGSDPYSSPAFDERVESGAVHPAAWSHGVYNLI